MSDDGPVVDLARGDRIDRYRVTSVLGHGKEGVAASVIDEFLQLPFVLKAYRAEPQWIDRLRYVARAFTDLAQIGLSPAPVSGGLTATSKSEPVAYLVVDHRVGRPIDELISRTRWTAGRARRLVLQLAEAVDLIHQTGWSLGDFEHGQNLVMYEGRPMVIDIGLADELNPGPFYEEDCECLAGIAQQLGAASGDDLLIEAANSLTKRCERRIDRRSFGAWLRSSPLMDI